MKIINLIFILALVSFTFYSHANNIDITKYFKELQGQIGYEGTDVSGQSNSINELESRGNAQKEDTVEKNKCTKKSCNVKNTFGSKASQERQQKAEETGINRNKSGFLDKAINIVKNAKNNDKEFNYLNGKQEDCKDKEEIIESTKTEKCDEYYDLKQSSCFPKQVVEIDPKYHYECHKKRDVKEKICEDKITSIKCEQSKECDLGGIEPGSVASDMMFHNDHGVLTIGTISDNYWRGNCDLYDKTTTFKIKNLKAIKDFTIFNVGFDDYMEIIVNSVSVYAGPDGGKDLKVIWKKEHFWNLPFINNGHIDKQCERGTDWNFAVNIDLKPYLREGENIIRIKVFVSGYGEGWLKIRAKQNCCSNWDITREEKCRFE